jgi:hypothetical protein
MSPPLQSQKQQAPFSLVFDHPSVTATTAWNVFRAERDCVIDAVRYYNATGLAEHSSNAFDIKAHKLEPAVIVDLVWTVDNATEICTSVAHGMSTGDGPVWISNAGGALPAGSTAATDYFVIRLGADTFTLASTRELAILGTAINFSGDGTGTQTLSDVASTKRLVQFGAGIDTDSDEAGTNTLLPSTWIALTLDTDAALDAGDELVLVATEDGTATLPAGRFLVVGRYLAPLAP